MDVPMLSPSNNPFTACLSPTAGGTADDMSPGGNGRGRVTFDVNCARDQHAPYPPHGPRTPTPLQAMSEFFTLENMEKVLNCVPLTVDPRSPNSRAANAFSFGDVPDKKANQAVSKQANQMGRAEARQDAEHVRFTPQEHAEFAFMAEREAVMNGEMDVPAMQVGSDKFADPGTLLQRVQETAWKLQANLSPRNCTGEADFGSPLSPRSCLGDAAVDVVDEGDVLTPKASNTPRVSSNNNQSPQVHVNERIPSSVFFGGGMDDIPSGVSGTPADGASEFPEVSSPADNIPGGLWSLPSNEVSGSLGASAEDAKEHGEDQVLMMRSPAAVDTKMDTPWMDDGAVSLSRSEEPSPGLDMGMVQPLNPNLVPAAEHAILAAQRAVSNAIINSPPMSPGSPGQTSYDDKYWMEDEVKESLMGMMQDREETNEVEDTGNDVGDAVEAIGEDIEEEESYEEDVRAMLEDEGDYSSYAPNPEKVSHEPDEVAEQREEEQLFIEPTGLVHPEDSHSTDVNEPDNETYTEQNEDCHHPYASDEEANAHFDAVFASFELSLNRPHAGLPKAKDESRSFRFDSEQVSSKQKKLSKKQTYRQARSPLMAAAVARKGGMKHPKSPVEREGDAASRASRDSKSSHSSFMEGTIGRKLNRRKVAVEGNIDGPADKTAAEEDGWSSLDESLNGSVLSNVSVLDKSGQAVTAATNKVSRDDDSAPDDEMHESMAKEGQYSTFSKDAEVSPPQPRVSARHKRGMKHIARLRSPKATKPQDEECPDDERMESPQEVQEEEAPDDEMVPQGAPPVADQGVKEENVASASDSGLDGIVASIHGSVAGGSSFDSSVNWDALAYSMSDNASANGGQVLTEEKAADVFVSSLQGPEPGPEAIGTAPTIARAVPAPSSVRANTIENSPKDGVSLDIPLAITDGVKHMFTPSVRQSRVPPSPEQHGALQHQSHQVDDVTDADGVVNNEMAPRAWQRIEEIKKKHDEDLNKIRSMINKSKAATSGGNAASRLTPKPAYEAKPLLKHRDLTIATPGDEENLPISPNTLSPIATTDQVKQRLESMRKQHEREVIQVQEELLPRPGAPGYYEMTPRTHGRVEIEVQSRIKNMREQHKKNMERMRHALEDVEEGTDSPETPSSEGLHIAESVRAWKMNANRFEKARQRFASHKATSTPSPKPRTGRHFSFDENSPRNRSIQELMSKNAELEKEILSSRSTLEALQPLSPVLSPVRGLAGANTTPRTPSVSDYSPRRYQAYTPPPEYTPRSNYGVSPSSRRENLQAMISSVDRQETEMNDRVSSLIADVKSFLEENDKREESLAKFIET